VWLSRTFFGHLISSLPNYSSSWYKRPNLQPIVFKLLTACDTFSRVSRTYPLQSLYNQSRLSAFWLIKKEVGYCWRTPSAENCASHMPLSKVQEPGESNAAIAAVSRGSWVGCERGSLRSFSPSAESGRRDYSRPLLSEPDVKVSLHPAQASQRPCDGPVSSDPTCWLHDTTRWSIP
jgi:hypothetical protein